MATKTTAVPKSVETAIRTTVSVMLAAIKTQDEIDAALAALFKELRGDGTYTLTNREPLDRVLSVKQAAEILGKSTRTVREMAKAGTLRAVFGGAIRERLTGISEASVRAFMSGTKEVAA